VETLAFNPKDLEILPGETVKWINIAGGNHNVDGSTAVFPDNPVSFYNGVPSTDNWSFEFTFDVPGVYQYRSELYQFLGMTGTINVKQPQTIVITEIMYNDPDAVTDSLEFVELYNVSDSPFDLQGYSLEFGASGYTFNLPPISLDPKTYLTICSDTTTFKKHFGFAPPSWDNIDVLSNNGDHIILKNDGTGAAITEVTYGVNATWPAEPNGNGYSLSLCRPLTDVNDPLNWQATPFPTGSFMAGTELHASPNKPGYCKFPVAETRLNNDDGTLMESGNGVTVEGTVYGVNLKSDGLQFTLVDDQNKGIAVYSETKDFGFEVAEGKDIRVMGILSQYNGLGQIYIDTLFVPGTISELFEPTATTVLNENTESQLVKINDVYLQNPENWVAGGSGFTVRATDGTNVYSIRIDDNVDLFNLLPPTGNFSITGIGGQFDSSLPYHEGYQLLPRYVEDIDPYNTQFEIPHYPIGLLRFVNDQGVADSLGVRCRIQGVVYGVNYRPNGLGFTVIDEFNDGMYVFLSNGNLDYTVTEGDLIEITGTMAQFNGLTQIVPEKIELISQGNQLFSPTEVSILDENTESQLVMISNVSIVNPTEWKGDGSTFNVNVTNGTNTFALRIHPASGLSSAAAPTGTFNVLGIGSQFDSASPYFDGYQLFPRNPLDIGFVNVDDLLGSNDLTIIPNPAKNHFSIISKENRLDKVMLFDQSGRKVAEYIDVETGVALSVADLPDGLYFIRVFDGTRVGFSKLAVVKSN
ncbi:MAG TPA: lamin tail domain-containing protein, partial [Saprospiraceae bacterium]|nr:lamin tail domain-containing protein [Saprospiraceae bacterium]